MDKKYHLLEQPIPEGFQIFEDRLEVVGVQYRKEAGVIFSKIKNGNWLEFEKEENNQYDANAIRVIGCHTEDRLFLGYVPKETAQLIAECGLFEEIKPRLLKTYIGDSGFIDIEFQILGPIGKKYLYLQTDKTEGTHYTDYIDRVKQLMQDKQHDEAIALLLKLVAWFEEDAAKKKYSDTWSWYHNQLAIVYRKEKRYKDEIEFLEEWLTSISNKKRQDHPASKRLEKVKALLIKSTTP